MEVYPTLAHLFNRDAAPEVPRIVRGWFARRKMSEAKCKAPGRHKGRERRHRREHSSHDGPSWLTALLRGELVEVRKGRLRHTLRELLDAHVPNAPPGFERVRKAARILLDQARRHGPASGWAIRRPYASSSPKATDWWVGKSSEKCWRWWRNGLRELGDHLELLDRWLDEVVPLQRPPLVRRQQEQHQEGTRRPWSTEAVSRLWRDNSTVRGGAGPLSLKQIMGM